MTGIGYHTELAQHYVAQVNSQQARTAAQESALEVGKAKRNVERLYLVVQAMWEIMSERLSLTNADLEAKIREIDLRDGKLDGQDRTQTLARICSACGRTLLSGQLQCSWCGESARNAAFAHER